MYSQAYAPDNYWALIKKIRMTKWPSRNLRSKNHSSQSLLLPDPIIYWGRNEAQLEKERLEMYSSTTTCPASDFTASCEPKWWIIKHHESKDKLGLFIWMIIFITYALTSNTSTWHDTWHVPYNTCTNHILPPEWHIHINIQIYRDMYVYICIYTYIQICLYT